MASFPEDLHPSHVQYLLDPPLNTARLYFTLLEKLDEETRTESLGLLVRMIGGARLRTPTDEPVPLSSLLDEVTFDNFKEGVLDLCQRLPEYFTVPALVSHSLHYLYRFSHPIPNAEAADRLTSMLAMLDVDRPGLNLTPDGVAEMKETLRMQLASQPERMARMKPIYDTFCNVVVAELLLEVYPR